MLALLSRPDSWLALATLSLLEVVLGIDNLIVLSILVAAAPLPIRRNVRNVGLSLALLMRLALLYSIVWLTGLRAAWFTIAGRGISPRELILGVGGVALLIKSATELRHALEPPSALQPRALAVGSSRWYCRSRRSTCCSRSIRCSRRSGWRDPTRS
jgi:predicted tellurium resistance membrane protein TerC